jgi:hypothetical protein
MSYPILTAFEASGTLVTASGPSQVKYAFKTASTAATHEVVAAVSGKKIRVVGFFVTAAAALNVQFKSAGTSICANLAISGVAQGYCPHGWFETAAGEALNMTLDTGTATSAQVVYVETV